MKPRRGKRTDRAGYALVLFLMMVLGLMGLAALVIDLGFARLAQRQMQTAVDSAALEGLRWRDAEQWEDLPQGWLADADFQAQVGVSGTIAGLMSTQQCEKVRRWAASRMAANAFDDDLEPTNGDTGQFGAGADRGFRGAHAWRASGYRWRREYAEAAVFTYDYHSDSHAYYQGEAAYDGESAGDWHGRHGRSVAISDDDTKLRMKAWQGYDVDCPDDKR